MLFYGIIMLVFSRLWIVVIESGALPEDRLAELLWYLAVTEWVVLSLPLIHLQIEADVRRGDIAYLRNELETVVSHSVGLLIGFDLVF